MKKRIYGKIGLVVVLVVISIWTINNMVESISYGLTSGDALGALIKIGVAIPIWLFLVWISRLAGRISSPQTIQNGK